MSGRNEIYGQVCPCMCCSMTGSGLHNWIDVSDSIYTSVIQVQTTACNLVSSLRVESLVQIDPLYKAHGFSPCSKSSRCSRRQSDTMSQWHPGQLGRSKWRRRNVLDPTKLPQHAVWMIWLFNINTLQQTMVERNLQQCMMQPTVTVGCLAYLKNKLTCTSVK